MRYGQIFRSEGGYCICEAIWGGNPVIDHSRVYTSLKQARYVRETKRLTAERDSKIEEAMETADDFEKEALRITAEYADKIKYAKPVAADDDPEK